MTTTVAHLPVATEPYVRERARRLAESDRAQVLLLRAQPTWTGDNTLTIDGATVRVSIGVSQLDVLDQVARKPTEEHLIILTDCDRNELGDTVLMGVHRQRLEDVDEWESVKRAFSALDIDAGLRRQGPWVPGALLTHRPPEGWSPVSAGLLTENHALSCLLSELLDRQDDSPFDENELLRFLDSTSSRARLRAVTDDVRNGLINWAAHGIGPVAQLALSAAVQPSAVSPVAVGLALEALWPEPPQSASYAQGQAQARIERLFGGIQPEHADARAFAETARQLLPGLSSAQAIRSQAEALLDDLGWPEGADTSNALPAGFWSRLRALADVLREGVREDALLKVMTHDLADDERDEVERARMAVRLARWLDNTEKTESVGATQIGDAILDYAHDGGWADRAFEVVFIGSRDPHVGAAYGRLLARARETRHHQDRRTADLLVDSTADDGPTRHVGAKGQMLPIETILPEVLTPLSRRARTLVIVLDGMSVRVATELAEDLTGWTEIVPDGSTHRTAGLSVLPTVTTYARTSLFSGQLAAGQQAEEKRAFRAPLFHKGDLRAPGGERLDEQVSTAINGSQQLVAIVLNTIDDALSKHDPGGMRWQLSNVQHLEPLVRAAHFAGRIVVLTSDHGHIVEHDSVASDMTAADSRWRSVDSGPTREGEVSVSGRRVMAPGGSAIMPWSDNIRYGRRQAGYHGGAAAPELTVPIITVVPPGQNVPNGWQEAIPQAPPWWNQPVNPPNDETSVPAQTRHKQRDSEPPTQQTLDLALPQPDVPNKLKTDTVEQLLSSDTYEMQRTKAGRMAPSDTEVAGVLRVLETAGGRMHRDTLATMLGLTAPSLRTRLAALRRVLNVEGYPVIDVDADGVTMMLDSSLLQEQFDLT